MSDPGKGFLDLVKAICPDMYENEQFKMDIFRDELASYRAKDWSEPECPLTQDELDELKAKILECKPGDKIEVHHKAYRDMLKAHLREHGGSCISVRDREYEHHPDNDLLVHAGCNCATPAALARWHGDYGFTGSYMGSYFLCRHCDEHVHSDHEGEKGSLGYKRVRGKNCLAVLLSADT